MEEAIFENVPGVFVGIDLGTSNSVVTYFKNGSFEQVSFKGRKIIPSVIFFEEEDQVIFGDRALKKGLVNGERFVHEFKRDLGTKKKYPLTFHLEFEKTEFNNNMYVLDTNIFIDYPYILDLFNKKDAIKLPFKDIDEISHIAKKENASTAAAIALEHLETCKNRLNISFEESYPELISDDLEKDTKSDNDNRILNIAKHILNTESERSVVLITNDNNLRLKAKVESVRTLSLDELKSEKSHKVSQDKQHVIYITPKDATRRLLKYIREESQREIGEEVQKAVITVPANFNQAQIGMVKNAGELAGFEEIKIQKEPVAVGFAYALDDSYDKTILVYDFGGGTFDVSLLKISDKSMTVIDTNGDPNLGGKDITRKVIELIYEKLIADIDINIDMYEFEASGLLKSDFVANERAIWNEAEKLKIDLSKYESSGIELANLVTTADGQTVNFHCELTRKQFEDEIAEIRKKSLDIVKDLINGSGVEKSKIDEIVMAGGSSSIPSIRDSLRDTLGIEPKMNIDSSIVISLGAAIEAMRNWSNSDTVQEIISFNEHALHDFGIGIKDFKFNVLIPANSALPISETRDYMTEKDGQESISLNIFQRKTCYPDAKKTHDNGIDFIDSLTISGLPNSKVGELKVRVTFELTKDDTLSLQVKIINENGEVYIEDGTQVTRASDA